MDEPSAEVNWSGTDFESDSAHFSEYLTKATANHQIRTYKQDSYEGLNLSLGDRVLDAGCGLGDDVLALAEIVGPIGEVIGIDNSASLIAEARTNATDVSGVRFAVQDIYAINFDAAAFDASRADRILQHLARPQDALDELVRVTKPGGRVSVIDPDWTALRMDVPENDPVNEVLDATYSIVEHPAMGRELYRRFQEAGLEDLAIDPFVITTTDFESVYEMAEIDVWLARLEEANEINSDRIATWTSTLQRADANGSFFASLPAYHVSGRVPRS